MWKRAFEYNLKTCMIGLSTKHYFTTILFMDGWILRTNIQGHLTLHSSDVTMKLSRPLKLIQVVSYNIEVRFCVVASALNQKLFHYHPFHVDPSCNKSRVVRFWSVRIFHLCDSTKVFHDNRPLRFVHCDSQQDLYK